VLPAFEYGSQALALLPNERAELHETTVYVRAATGLAQARRAAAVAARIPIRHFAVSWQLMSG
jgi:hypothetical protein